MAIETVADMIKELQKYPPDMKLEGSFYDSMDFGEFAQPLTIEVFPNEDDESTLIVFIA